MLMLKLQKTAKKFNGVRRKQMAQKSERSMHFLARQAKYRMTGGYYGAAARRGENGRSLKQSFENKLLLDKIEALVKSGTDTQDAIGRLVDKKLIETADEVTRQRHVLQIAATYVKAKREITRRVQTV